MVLVDTSIIIDFLNRNRYKEVISTLLSTKEFATTEIIIMEVLQGVKEDKTYDKIKIFLESLPLVGMKYEDYIEAANIYRTCRRKGKKIPGTFLTFLLVPFFISGIDR
jgi:predicted nucleic acid-binding protein